MCDGKDDCGDRSDEKHCSAVALGYSIRLVGSEKQNEGMVQVTGKFLQELFLYVLAYVIYVFDITQNL